jgi:hypothetical protein
MNIVLLPLELANALVKNIHFRRSFIKELKNFEILDQFFEKKSKSNFFDE